MAKQTVRQALGKVFEKEGVSERKRPRRGLKVSMVYPKSKGGRRGKQGRTRRTKK